MNQKAFVSLLIFFAHYLPSIGCFSEMIRCLESVNTPACPSPLTVNITLESMLDNAKLKMEFGSAITKDNALKEDSLAELKNGIDIQLTDIQPVIENNPEKKIKLNYTLEAPGMDKKNWNQKSFIMTVEFNFSFNHGNLNIKFKNTKQLPPPFQDICIKLTEDPIIIKLKPFIYFNEREKLYLNIMRYVIYVVLGVLVGCFFPLLVLNSLGLFWQFLDMLQILNILMFLNVDYPIQVLNFLSSLSVSNIEMGVYSQYFVIQNLEYHEELSKIPVRFREQQRPSRFFKNAGMAVTFWGVIVLLYILSKMFTCIFLGKKKESQINTSLFYRIIVRVNDWTEYSAIIRGFLVIFVQLCLSCFLQFRNLSFVDMGTQLNSSLAIISLILIVYFILFSVYVVNSYNFEDDEEGIESENLQKFYPLIDLLKTRSIFKRNFINMYTVRKLVWVLSLIYLEDYPLSQMFLTILVSAFIVTIHLIKNPYKDIYVNYVNFITEFGTLLALIFIALIMVVDFVYSPNYLDIDRRSFYGWVIIVILSIIIFLKLIFVLWGIIINIKDILPKTKAMIKDLKDDKPFEENVEMAEMNNNEDKAEIEELDDFFDDSYRKLYEGESLKAVSDQNHPLKISNFAPQNLNKEGFGSNNNAALLSINEEVPNSEQSPYQKSKLSKGKRSNNVRPSVTFGIPPVNSLKLFQGGENKI